MNAHDKNQFMNECLTFFRKLTKIMFPRNKFHNETSNMKLPFEKVQRNDFSNWSNKLLFPAAGFVGKALQNPFVALCYYALEKRAEVLSKDAKRFKTVDDLIRGQGRD